MYSKQVKIFLVLQKSYITHFHGLRMAENNFYTNDITKLSVIGPLGNNETK